VFDPTLQANLYQAFFNAWSQSGDTSLAGVYFWNWDPNPAEVGPGNGANFSPQGLAAQNVVTTEFTAPCFLAGTRIATRSGEVAVEDLRIGDAVQTVLGKPEAPIVWIGHRHVDCAHHPKPRQVWPVRVAAGAFGPGWPRIDLFLSPDHAVYVDEVLIPVKYLINGSSITQVPLDDATYYHVELPEHSVLLAEGLAVESYLDTGDRSNFINGGGAIALYPDFASLVWDAAGCAPLVVTGSAIDAARRWVNAIVSKRYRRPECQSGLNRVATI
jgi:hypothetical protein